MSNDQSPEYLVVYINDHQAISTFRIGKDELDKYADKIGYMIIRGGTVIKRPHYSELNPPGI